LIRSFPPTARNVDSWKSTRKWRKRRTRKAIDNISNILSIARTLLSLGTPFSCFSRRRQLSYWTKRHRRPWCREHELPIFLWMES
jgi:hypothetical protein